MQKTLLIIAVVLLLVWLVLRRRRDSQGNSKEAPPAPSQAAVTAYHAVSIKFGEIACDAARAMSGRRFLSNAAPRLPLPDCDAGECHCKFVHHSDRRSGKDRRSPFAAGGFGGGTGSFQKERRGRSDRREDADTDPF